ncbi:MAG TPA: DUF1491 family protein [Sphingopyxis sp.]|nr:DUF1491 family protein [Sphingopyxis sp.]
MTRLTSRLWIDSLIRAVQAEGGFAMILAKGYEHGGGILVQCCDRGVAGPLFERRYQMDGDSLWDPVGPAPESSAEERQKYLERRRQIDPDLWIIELDIANSEQFIARWAAIS